MKHILKVLVKIKYFDIPEPDRIPVILQTDIAFLRNSFSKTREIFEFAVGDEMCKLEAMKMNNSIRSNRTGTIGTIHVNVGQQVKHGDLLIEFAEG